MRKIGRNGSLPMMKKIAKTMTHPKNNYSDLNSLRARLAHKDWNGKGKPNADGRSIEYRFSASDSVIWNKYI